MFGANGLDVTLQENTDTPLSETLLFDSDTHLNENVTMQSDEWKTYHSDVGGYSFDYPAAYTVTELETAHVQVRPTEASPATEIITFMYLPFEIVEGEQLLEWAELYNMHYKEGQYEVTFRSIADDHVYMESTATSPIPIQGHLLVNHQLILRLSTHYTDDSKHEIIERMVESIQFAADAPQNMAQLYAPAPPPPIVSLTEFVALFEERELVSRAVQFRTDTGETPTDLLAQMSERGRRDYYLTLEANRELIEDIDRERGEPTPTAPSYSESDYQSYLKAEEAYNQTLADESLQSDKEVESNNGSSSPFPLIHAAATQANCSGVVPTTGLDNRRGLPARYVTPIREYPTIVRCGSSLHVGEDTYAADFSVIVGTDVYATTQNETISVVQNTYNGIGYGRYVRTRALQMVRGIWLWYYNLYAHLDQIDVAVDDVLGPTDLIGASGSTGTDPNDPAPHLHFAMRTHILGSGFKPVDLSPIKGFTPNLYYPAQCQICGTNDDPAHEPIIIEADEFQTSSQPVASGHYWNCSTFHPTHTGTCYRAAIPITPHWVLDPINILNSHLSPRISYNVWLPAQDNYRIWVCGMGGHTSADSLHMGMNGLPYSSADRVVGYHTTNWVWRSQTIDGPVPSVSAQQGYNYIDIWVRENEMRVDRILLTRDFNFNPDTNQLDTAIRCGAEHLYD